MGSYKEGQLQIVLPENSIAPANSDTKTPHTTNNDTSMKERNVKQVEMNGPKLACKLTSPELQKRRATTIHELKELILLKEETGYGYKYIFNSHDDVLDKLIDFVKSERLCCDFFSFQLSIEGQKAALEITGPEGSKKFLDHEVGL